MSISNILQKNDFTIYADTLKCREIQTEISPSKIYPIQNTSGNTSTNFPNVNGTDPNIILWGAVQGVFPGTWVWPLDNTYTQTIDITLTMTGLDGATTRAGGIAFQFQNISDDTWTTSGIPYQWQVVNNTEAVGVKLIHQIPNDHPYKNVRLLANCTATNVRFGFAPGDFATACYCSGSITSNL
jgi:hypothetical protein